MEDARIKEEATQPSATAFIFNSLPITGKAILMAEPMKGVKNEPITATHKAALIIVFSCFINTILLLKNRQR